MSAAHRSAVVARRCCALVAVGSGGLHLASLGHAASPVTGALLAVMIAGCLFCARELWVLGSVRAWLIVGLMNIAMIGLHLPAPVHHHGVSAPAADPSPAMGAATLLAMAEVTVAAVALYLRSRHLGLPLTGDRNSRSH